MLVGYMIMIWLRVVVGELQLENVRILNKYEHYYIIILLGSFRLKLIFICTKGASPSWNILIKSLSSHLEKKESDLLFLIRKE